MIRHLAAALALTSLLTADAFADAPATQPAIPSAPRIESVIPSPNQPAVSAKSTIWFDDFDGPEKSYAESAGPIDRTVGFGGQGGSMLCLYLKDTVGKGNRKVFFGDSPAYRNKTVRKTEKFDEIYWRIYVKHQEGWISGTAERGGPDKLARATSIVSDTWRQAMISHVWSVKDTLTLDPASGVKDGQVVTTKYNDFANLHWLGNRPPAKFPIHSTAEAGWWVCVECRIKLNTPGKKDGLNQLWIDGRLEAERKNLDFRGTYSAHGINAVFLEAYWNKGSPVDQKRWYDNFIISTAPIGPVTAPRNPTLLRTPYHGPGQLDKWQVQLASDPDGKDIIFISHDLPPSDRCQITPATGIFEGTLTHQTQLAPAHLYYTRIRQRPTTSPDWSNWTPWHQCFRSEPDPQ